MNPKDIEELLQREPFLPIRIFMSDGNTFDIPRTLSVAMGKSGLFIILPDDRCKWIPLRQVASVAMLQAA